MISASSLVGSVQTELGEEQRPHEFVDGKEARRAGSIELTIPDHPRISKQRYHLAEDGAPVGGGRRGG